MSAYKPRRSRARWLEGAPAALLAVYDNGGKTADRYTALYGAPLWVPEYYRIGRLPCRGMSADPYHPQGVGMFGECERGPHLGRKVRFADLPEPVRRCIIADCRCDLCGGELVSEHTCPAVTR
jgi:hypothetical protein